ncbi:MAG: bacteriophage abortive infection AbiH family protein [Leadbetterella sp.]|nr:bacteriophage abortive infection AbiH family protein [Leadbetterella sp.]
MSDRIYIIGNGFDLHHDLKTKYSNFATYLEANNKDLYDILKNHISFPQSDPDLWSNFEENLANLDVDEILSDNSYVLPNYASDDFREGDRYLFPDIMDEYFEKLKKLIEEFQGFIQNVEYLMISEELKIELESDSFFLTFNYTNTLERLYKIDKKNILYIHNSAFYGSGRIILGHGMDPKHFQEQLQEPPDDVDIDDYEKWYQENVDYEYSYNTGEENLMRYFEATFKPTKEIINSHSSFFSSINKYKEVFILGHSLSNIDLPYFEEIFKNSSPNTEWRVSYYNGEEGKKHFETLINLGIKEDKITLFNLPEIQQNNRQLKFKF